MARTVDPVKHAARRAHIRDHAARLFAEQGFERTTTAQICRAAGISPGNLYHYFASKKEIFLALLTADEQDIAGLLESCLHSDAPLEALLRFVDHLAAPAGANPIVPGLVLEAMLQAHRNPEVREVLEAAGSQERRGLAALVRRAIDAGEVDPVLDPEEAAAWLATLVGAVYLDGALSSAFDPVRQLANLHRSARAYLTEERRKRVSV